jgi:hypothetical protein
MEPALLRRRRDALADVEQHAPPGPRTRAGTVPGELFRSARMEDVVPATLADRMRHLRSLPAVRRTATGRLLAHLLEPIRCRR